MNTIEIEPTEPTEPIETTAKSNAAAVADPDAVAALLAQAPPSAGALSTLIFERMSPAGRLDAVVAWEHLVRHAHAGLIRALSALTHAAGNPPRPADHAPDSRRLANDAAKPRPLVREALDSRWLAESEVCAALAWSPATAQHRLHEAHALTRLFPQTLQLLCEGHISLEQARCLANLTTGLTDETAHTVQQHVITRMPGQNTAVTRQAIRRAILRTDPHAAAKRHQHQRTRRHVELHPEDDGMATLSFYLPADVAQMAMRTLTDMAQRAKPTNKNSNDKRTLDQRRADLLPALLSRAPGTNGNTTSLPAVAARVNVVIGIETLLGLSHEPAHLDGYGPICADQARRIAHAHAARWRFLLTATDGTLAHASPRTYTPTAAIKHITQLKHTTCAFPHCAMPSDRCDLDHNLAHHKGGNTTVGNLAPLCRRHHNSKSFGHWHLNRDGENIQWTSNLTGRNYLTTSTHYPPAA